jgi:predicted RNA-binding protein with PIN domain
VRSLLPKGTTRAHIVIGRKDDFSMPNWLVDGMNVVGSRPDGWWRDRRGAMRALAERLALFARESGEPVAVVFDGQPFELDAAPADVSFAPTRGPNAADDEIARRVAADSDPGAITVVTSDRALAERVRAHGAEVVGASTFRRQLDEL